MAVRRRTDTITAISTAEAEYGTPQLAIACLNDAPLSFNINKTMVSLTRKIGQLLEMPKEELVGRFSPSITIDSPFYPALLTAFSEYFDLDSDTTDGDFKSYTIRQLDPSSATAGNGIEMTGGKLQSMTLSQSDGIWRISLDIAGKTIVLEKAVSDLTGASLKTLPTETPYRFDLGHKVCSLVIGEDEVKDVSLEDLSITINFERADENVVYRNSQSKVNDLICKITGEINITYTWDDADPFETSIFTEGQECTFLLAQPNSGGLEIEAHFVMTNWDRPDDTSCVYSATITGKITNKVSISQGIVA